MNVRVWYVCIFYYTVLYCTAVYAIGALLRSNGKCLVLRPNQILRDTDIYSTLIFIYLFRATFFFFDAQGLKHLSYKSPSKKIYHSLILERLSEQELE